MGLLSNMTEKATKEWAQNLTLEQIEEFERQGADMSEYRIMYEERQAEKKRQEDAVDLNLLDKFKKTPRSVDFIDEVAKFNKISDKKKQNLEQTPLVYGKVVQAYWSLFKPCASKDEGSGGIVFLFALDDAHRYNDAWLTKTAERISQVKESVPELPETMTEKICRWLNLNNNFIYTLTIGAKQKKRKFEFLPEDCRDFIRTLSDDRSSFCFPLGRSLNEEGADAWCATFTLEDQHKLPFSYIPHNKIVPFLMTEDLEQRRPKRLFWGGIDDYTLLIPPRYYTNGL